MSNFIDSSRKKKKKKRQPTVWLTCPARSSCYTFEPPGSETGLCLSRLIFLSGENHLQLVNAFEKDWNKITDKNVICPLHPCLARIMNAPGP